MGPSGSGKSTLMHCIAGLDTLTSGSGVHRRRRPRHALRQAAHPAAARPLGFVFQAFNLVPTLTARENITLPIVARRASSPIAVARQGHRHRRASATGCITARPSSPAASSSASRSHVRWRAGPTSSSPTNRPATSTPAPAPRCSASCARPDELGQTIVMVTHDPVAATYADAVVFLADGRIVDDLAGAHARRRARPHPQAWRTEP